MANALDRILSGSPYGFSGGVQGDDIDPDSVRQMLLAIGRGAIAEPIAGLVGLGSLPFGVDKAVSNIKGVQDWMGYQPEKADMLRYIGQVAAPATEWATNNIGDLRTKAGNATLEATGSPGLASTVHSLPEALGLIATGGAMVPAVRAVSRAVPAEGGVDMGRRNAAKKVAAGAGLMGAAAIAPKMVGKSLMDAPVAGKAAPAAASAVAKAIPRAAVTPSTLRMIQMLRSYPLLKAAYKKGGKDGFEAELDEINYDRQSVRDEIDEIEQSDGFQKGNEELLQHYDAQIEYSQDIDNRNPFIYSDNGFQGVNWKDVDKHLDNDKDNFDVVYDGRADQIVERYFNDYPDGMGENDVFETFTDLSDMDSDFEDIMSRRDFDYSINEALNSEYLDNKKTADTLERMAKDPDSYDRYIKAFEEDRTEFGGEYFF